MNPSNSNTKMEGSGTQPIERKDSGFSMGSTRSQNQLKNKNYYGPRPPTPAPVSRTENIKSTSISSSFSLTRDIGSKFFKKLRGVPASSLENSGAENVSESSEKKNGKLPLNQLPQIHQAVPAFPRPSIASRSSSISSTSVYSQSSETSCSTHGSSRPPATYQRQQSRSPGHNNVTESDLRMAAVSALLAGPLKDDNCKYRVRFETRQEMEKRFKETGASGREEWKATFKRY